VRRAVACRARTGSTSATAAATGTSIPPPGHLDVASKLRSGSYFPDWLEQRAAEAALTSVVATCYLLGVSTRRMEASGSSGSPGCPGRGSARWRDLDAQVERSGPGHWTLPVHVRSGGAGAQSPRGRPRRRPRAAGGGGNADGHRRSWACRSPAPRTARGGRILPGPDRPRPDRSPARHLRRPPRLAGAIGDPARRQLARVPDPLRRQLDVHPQRRLAVGQALHSVYDQPDANSVHDQYDRLIDAITLSSPRSPLTGCRPDRVRPSPASPGIWRQIWSNPLSVNRLSGHVLACCLRSARR
jgi:hypothetical protein